jgi:uncharacterized protein (TIGR02301 family)
MTDHGLSKPALLLRGARPFHTPAVIFRQNLPMFNRLKAPVLAAALMLLATPAWAQDMQQQPPAAQTGEAWYRQQLVDLSGVLGGAHYLRILCEGRGDQRWRDYMRGVITREPRYERDLTAAFNQGYRDEEMRYDDCNREAQQSEAELRARGLRIADALRVRRNN